MRGRQPLPSVWLMTDERFGDALWAALERLPRGSGVVFRHHSTPQPERTALWAAIRRVARRRRLVLIRAGTHRLPGEAGAHNARIGTGIRTGAAHDRREAIARVRHGCDLLFVSPVFATRSHPGALALGPMRAAGVARGLRVMPIAMGGLDRARFRAIRALGFHGWAAIDAWMSDQKRNAVPR